MENCNLCRSINNDLVKAPSFYKGENYKGILLIGESPHSQWLISGSPFMNKEGKLLPSSKNIKRYLEMLRLGFDEIALIEVVKCVVTKRSSLDKMMENCLPFLKEQLESFSPQIVIILGQKTAEMVSKLLCLDLKPLTRVDSGEVTYISLYHPSPINQNNNKRNIKFLKEFKV